MHVRHVVVAACVARGAQEYVAAKSPGLSMKSYLDIQRVANRVWQHHFKHKADIRGKVVPTFDQLSSLADTMASRIKVSTDAAKRATSNEKELLRQLKRVSLEKRQLEVRSRAAWCACAPLSDCAALAGVLHAQ